MNQSPSSPEGVIVLEVHGCGAGHGAHVPGGEHAGDACGGGVHYGGVTQGRHREVGTFKLEHDSCRVRPRVLHLSCDSRVVVFEHRKKQKPQWKKGAIGKKIVHQRKAIKTTAGHQPM